MLLLLPSVDYTYRVQQRLCSKTLRCGVARIMCGKCSGLIRPMLP